MDDKHVKTAGFSRRSLPVAVALLALLVYGVTLNHWHSFRSLGPASLALGIDWWNFKIGHPLFYLVAEPIGWLPVAWQVIALNAVSALCGAGVLALLARTVALLPQDRTQDQRLRNTHAAGLLNSPFDWLPPVFAVLLCGFQMTFWEHATVATGEMLNLLLFAFVIWCLAEFRVDRGEGRLRLAFFAYGMGIATNWGMVGFLPVFGIAILWLKGFSFFKWRFLLGSFGLLCAGMLLYLYDPIMAVLDPSEPTGFWDILRWELVSQRNPLLGYPKGRMILLSVTSILPLLMVAIHWPTNFGDVSGFGAAVANLLFRLVHLVFMAAIVWVAFDPAFSPRELGYGLPMLTFYYLGALSAGYLAGYFLVIGGGEPLRKWQRSGTIDRVVGRVLYAGVWLAVLVVPAMLLRQNLPKIRVENGDLTRRFAGQMAARLPAEGALVLGADLERLHLLNAWYHGKPEPILFSSMADLGRSRFHKRAAARYPKLWPDPGKVQGEETITIAAVVNFLGGMSRSRPLWATDSLAGTLLLESLRAVPRGLVYELKPYADDATLEWTGNRMEPAELDADLDHVAAIAEQLKADLASGSETALVVGRNYSAWVNTLGAEAQAAGDLERAAAAFETALSFNPENVNARINADVNARLADGLPGTSEETSALEQELAQVRSLSQLLLRHGPIDESQIRTYLGELLLGNRMHRQSVAELSRALSLNGTNTQARLDLGRAYHEIGFITNSASVLEPLGSEDGAGLNAAQSAELQRLLAMNAYRRGDVAGAEARLLAASGRHADQVATRDGLVTIYIETGRFADALVQIEALLRLKPDHQRARFNLGPVLSSLGRNDEAIIALTDLLKDQTNNAALFGNRASVYLGIGKLAEAESDYRKALELNYTFQAGYVGLAEVALKGGDTNAALTHLDIALKLMPAESREAKALAARLESLRKTP
ncbi:MAG: tetratricopeptide repeat protein [Verrucomicrobiae bacterium]|nr:tetratricopeptide repeat protein [Verrucomicrobiae bacterium]